MAHHNTASFHVRTVKYKITSFMNTSPCSAGGGVLPKKSFTEGLAHAQAQASFLDGTETSDYVMTGTYNPIFPRPSVIAAASFFCSEKDTAESPARRGRPKYFNIDRSIS